MLMLRKGYKVRVSENRVLKKMYRPARNEIIGEWRRMHKEKLHDLYSSPNITRVMKYRKIRWARYVTRMGESRSAFRALGGKPE
jgi:hypothetical protein